MHNSKLILLLKTFSNKEFREFFKFLHSPFYNQKDDVIKFYEVLKKAAPDFQEKKIHRRVILKKVFPKSHYDEKKYKYISNLLLKLAEKYISLKEIEGSTMVEEYHLLNSYIKRGIDKNYNFIYNKTVKNQTDETKRDSTYYYSEYLLKKIAAKHFDKKRVRQQDETIIDLLQGLDIYYYTNKLKYTCHLINNQLLFPKKDIRPFTIIKEFSFPEEVDIKKYPPIHLYYELHHLLMKGEEAYFTNIKTLLKEYKTYFDTDEFKDIYFIIINYCIKQLLENNRTKYHLLELYRIYKKGIDDEVLLEKGFISPWTFKNIIKIGIRLKKYEETELFIKENKHKLKEEFQSDAYHYNMAELSFIKGDYNKALEHTNLVEYSDIYYILDTKLLKLKIFYNNKDFDVLESNLIAVHTYIKRNKIISQDIKIPYFNFIKTLWKIIRNKHDKETLINKIKNNSSIEDKSWLLQILQD